MKFIDRFPQNSTMLMWGVELSVDEFLKHVFSLKVNDVAKLNIIKRAVDSGKKTFNVNNGKNFKVVAMFDCEGEKSWYYV